MKLSWDIQRTKHHNRAKALTTAWAIVNNEDVTVFYLVRKLNHFKPLKDRAVNQYGLFA